MIQETLLEEVMIDQAQRAKNKPRGIPRQLDYGKLLTEGRIVVISGIRRSGKSTILHQLGEMAVNCYFLDFDDERLINFDVADFSMLMILWQKRYPAGLILLDEIQNVSGWERFVRRAFDEGYKIVITGSNSRLLSSELATHLTGRYYKQELFPYDFRELLTWKGIDFSEISSGIKAAILTEFDNYLENGGMPEFYKLGDRDYFSQVYSDVIYKDLIVRFSIKNVKAFKNLTHYLFSNFTKEISYNALSKLLGIQSVNTVKDYIDHLQESYMAFECHKFDYSLKRQYASNKKIYVIDNGIRNNVSFRFNTDKGQLLENIVFLQLKRHFPEVYFYKTKSNFEVDFFCSGRLYQVCWSIKDLVTFEREKRALVEAMKETGSAEAHILTYNEDGLISEDSLTIKVIPVWRWVIQGHESPHLTSDV